MWIPFYLSLLLGLLASVSSNPIENQEIQIMYETLPIDEFVNFFNRQNFTYKISSYKKRILLPKIDPFFDGRRKLEGEDYEVHDGDFIDKLPKNFDPRKTSKWRKCKTLKEISDQGECGSCWAVATASAISDRICIHKKKVVRVSPQDFECSKCVDEKNKSVCFGGDKVCAMEHWKDYGLVTQKCKPYNVLKLNENVCHDHGDHDTCVIYKNYKKDKHFGKKVYNVPNDPGQIKAELYNNGPIVASITVFNDFMLYKSGIYEHKFEGFKNETGGHAIKLIGYGEENGIEYWITANSWGSARGEDGFYRIKTDFQFNSLVAGVPE